MGPKKENPRAGTLVFAVGERTEKQRALNALINRYEQSPALDVKEAILVALEQFDGKGHSHPKWIRPVMEANVAAALGDYEAAIEHERVAERYAMRHLPQTQHLLALSKNNLSDHLRRIGRCGKAIGYAYEAYELWPENDGIIVNFALALFKSGRRTEADSIIGRLTATSDIDDSRNILRAHALYEEELEEMSILPSVKTLMARTSG